MNIYFEVNEFEKFTNFSELNLEELGFLTYISKKNISLINIINIFKITINDIRYILEKLDNKKIITFEMKYQGDNCYWIISFISNKNLSSELIINKNDSIKNSRVEKLMKIFLLSKQQIISILKSENELIIVTQLYNLINENFEKYEKKIVINNMQEYKNYLSTSSYITILMNLKINVDKEIIDLIYRQLIINDYDIALINFLIEYIVTNSIYKNFSKKYFELILENWTKLKINSLDKALAHVEEIKKTKNKSKYIIPNWDKDGIVKSNNVDIQLIEKMLKEEKLT